MTRQLQAYPLLKAGMFELKIVLCATEIHIEKDIASTDESSMALQAFSGRSIDSNMSISPVAGSGSANINPFTAVDEVAAQPATSGTSLPALFPPAMTAASSGPASNFAFGAAAAASAATSGGGPDAASKPGLFASAGEARADLLHRCLWGVSRSSLTNEGLRPAATHRTSLSICNRASVELCQKYPAHGAFVQFVNLTMSPSL